MNKKFEEIVSKLNHCAMELKNNGEDLKSYTVDDWAKFAQNILLENFRDVYGANTTITAELEEKVFQYPVYASIHIMNICDASVIISIYKDYDEYLFVNNVFKALEESFNTHNTASKYYYTIFNIYHTADSIIKDIYYSYNKRYEYCITGIKISSKSESIIAQIDINVNGNEYGFIVYNNSDTAINLLIPSKPLRLYNEKE